MNHACAVSGLQCAAELTDHRRGLPTVEGAVDQHVGEAATLHQPHHEVGRIGFAPIVVERNDVRMLEPGDELCLGLEAPDEVRIVGQFGPDDLDRDLAPDGGLVRPVRHAERTLADLLTQLVSPDSQAR